MKRKYFWKCNQQGGRRWWTKGRTEHNLSAYLAAIIISITCDVTISALTAAVSKQLINKRFNVITELPLCDFSLGQLGPTKNSKSLALPQTYNQREPFRANSLHVTTQMTMHYFSFKLNSNQFHSRVN